MGCAPPQPVLTHCLFDHLVCPPPPQPELTQPNLTSKLQSMLEPKWVSSQVFPPKDSIFRAFNACPFDQVGGGGPKWRR